MRAGLDGAGPPGGMARVPCGVKVVREGKGVEPGLQP
jgi:hypothetical protein